MIQKRLDFVFEPFLNSWKSGQNDQNGKGNSKLMGNSKLIVG